jgi:hypothetical protein
VLTITTHSGTPLGERGREQLQRLVGTYDVERWLFAREILVRSFVHPTSHPVLTLSTRQVEDDDGCLGTFLHEQFHWYAAGRIERTEAATGEFRGMFPSVPVGPPEGAKSEESSYLHLVVCTLELDALRQLVGEERARRVITGRGYYQWIYRQALDDEGPLRVVLERHGVGLP